MNQDIKEMSDIFKILSNDVRLCIISKLCYSGEQKVTDLQNCAGASQSFVSQQLSKLRNLGIVSSRKEGIEIYYSLVDKKICNIIQKLEICKLHNKE